MKYIILTALSVCAIAMSCKEKTTIETTAPANAKIVSVEIPNKTVEKSALIFDHKSSTWKLDHKLYSGYAVSYHQNGSSYERTGMLKGRKENQDSSWYTDGHLKQTANYCNGKLHGERKFWLSDTTHVLISHLNYLSGKPHGEQKTWYPTGELHKQLNLDMGKEEGIQQAFRKNGALYANYEAKNGRTFGLKKASLCFGLEDERVSYEK